MEDLALGNMEKNIHKESNCNMDKEKEAGTMGEVECQNGIEIFTDKENVPDMDQRGRIERQARTNVVEAQGAQWNTPYQRLR